MIVIYLYGAPDKVGIERNLVHRQEIERVKEKSARQMKKAAKTRELNHEVGCGLVCHSLPIRHTHEA